ncbi:hypothetical protein SBBP2_1330007 [Burkholderiales bacterium]|nr:hypothetical protein SBBP2_1330007 [Burkholderiales bacterium]
MRVATVVVIVLGPDRFSLPYCVRDDSLWPRARSALSGANWVANQGFGRQLREFALT